MNQPEKEKNIILLLVGTWFCSVLFSCENAVNLDSAFITPRWMEGSCYSDEEQESDLRPYPSGRLT